jgi:hypothetical protein
VGDPDLQSSYDSLQRYAGWLGRDRASGTVRADVRALGAAIEEGGDASALLLTLEADIARLPGGDMRKLLRVTAGHVRHALGAPQ